MVARQLGVSAQQDDKKLHDKAVLDIPWHGVGID